ncbi:MAG: hypothetical protein IPH10_10790 [bacterium]|nr:hypothetical protein [bacterium]
MRDLNSLLSQGKINLSHLEQDVANLHIGPRAWNESGREIIVTRTNDEGAWPWETIFDHLRDAGCLVKHGDTGGWADWIKQKKICGQNRKCVWIDLKKAPRSFANWQKRCGCRRKGTLRVAERLHLKMPRSYQRKPPSIKDLGAKRRRK